MKKIIFAGGQIDAEFRRYFDQRRMSRTETNVLAQYESLVRDSIPRPETSVRSTVAASEMHGYLESARKIVEQDLRQRAQYFSPFQWLWYLRHVPLSCWPGKLQTTVIYDSALAEFISSGSAASATPETKRLLRYPVNQTIADLVAEFIAGIRYLSQIHSNLRWAGKGAEFSLDELAVGSAVPSLALRAAVELYDSRVEAIPTDFLSTTGSVVWTEASTVCSSEIIGFSRARQPNGTRFVAGRICLDELARLNNLIIATGSGWWSEELPLLVGLLRAAKGLIESDVASTLKAIGLGWLQTNNEIIDTAPDYVIEDAAAVATQIFPGIGFPTTLRKLFDAVSKIKGNGWPSRSGPAIRTEGDLVFIDLFASTMMLHEFAEFNTQGGAQGNLRGRDFERAVNAVIDLSSWAPPRHIRQNVGQTIRIGGRDITDLDALGFKDMKLMIVSCKSRIYSARFDQGDPRTIRGTLSVATEALTRWLIVKSILEANPRCVADLDLSSIEILPVVCLPHIPYLPIGTETSFVAPGLRAIVSVSELRRWLANEDSKK